MEIEINSIVVMKKEHPCHKSSEMKIIRIGVDVQTKCLGCDSIVLIPRENFEKKLKKIKEKKTWK